MTTLTKIKEFSNLVSQIHKLGLREIKLDQHMAVALMAEINILMATKIENTKEETASTPELKSLNGGSFN
jgi:hypothetical protein